jgi:hypothetical protein
MHTDYQLHNSALCSACWCKPWHHYLTLASNNSVQISSTRW